MEVNSRKKVHGNKSEKDHFICHYHVDDGYEIALSSSSVLSKHAGTDLYPWALNWKFINSATKDIAINLFLTRLYFK